MLPLAWQRGALNVAGSFMCRSQCLCSLLFLEHVLPSSGLVAGPSGGVSSLWSPRPACAHHLRAGLLPTTPSRWGRALGLAWPLSLEQAAVRWALG